MRRINSALEEAGCELEAVLVPGKWNVADQPSRGVDLCAKNEEATRRVIREALTGKSRVLCDWGVKIGESREERERKVAGWRWAPGMEEEARLSEGFGEEDENEKRSASVVPQEGEPRRKKRTR